ncbi:MAG: glycosyltransferase family 4 protein [Bacteroidales bacterium]|nr:glycosyltransferase family 4 protein [Bacteroidales bacterium]
MVESRSRKLIFVNQDSGYLMIDIINAYARAGYSCALITGRLVERNIPLHDSVKIDKIIRYNRSTLLKRLFTSLLALWQILWIIVWKYPKSELFIVSNPPFAPLLPLFLKNPFSILIYDIFPDVLSELGYLKPDSRIIKLWGDANRKVFRKAKHVFTISQGMQEVLSNYMNGKMPQIVPIWTDNSFLKPVDPSVNPFIKKHKLTGRFIVMYSGNIGLSSEVETLIEVASAIVDEKIFFVIIGEGAKKDLISQMVASMRLNNVLLLPWQATEELPFSLSAASLAVVTLGKQGSKLAVPSKFYNYMSVGAPILCISPKGSEVEKLVSSYDCGRSFDTDNIPDIVQYIYELANNEDLCANTRLQSLIASKDFQFENVEKFLVS